MMKYDISNIKTSISVEIESLVIYKKNFLDLTKKDALEMFFRIRKEHYDILLR